MTTPAAPNTITCIFCGEVDTRGRKGEDIVSDWYAREAGGPGKYAREVAELTAETSRSSTRHSQTVAAFRLSDVCTRCNNGWMAVLEQRAMPILLPMIRGQRYELSDSEARIVAAWGQVKAVTLDASYDVLHLPTDVPSSMFGSSLPLLRMGVTLAACDDDPGVKVKVTRRTGGLRMAEMDSGARVENNIARFTLVFGRLVVQASWVLAGRLPVEMLLGLGHESWLPIWPPNVRDGALSWPPAAALTPETLPCFC